ncbi:MAG: hypothetical protein ACOY45_10205 [Pseudomonadota bacterium]
MIRNLRPARALVVGLALAIAACGADDAPDDGVTPAEAQQLNDAAQALDIGDANAAGDVKETDPAP